ARSNVNRLSNSSWPWRRRENGEAVTGEKETSTAGWRNTFAALPVLLLIRGLNSLAEAVGPVGAVDKHGKLPKLEVVWTLKPVGSVGEERSDSTKKRAARPRALTWGGDDRSVHHIASHR